MTRITQKILEAKVSGLNALTGKTDDIYRTDESGKVIGGNPGTFCISGAYGGYSLHRMSDGGGTGVSDVFSCGHVSARELAGMLDAFTRGIRYSRELVAA